MKDRRKMCAKNVVQGSVAMPDDPNHYKDNLYCSGVKMLFGTTKEMSHFH